MIPKNVIIFAQPKDSHACAVDYALREIGHKPTLFNTAEIANGEALSARYTGDRVDVRIGNYTGPLSEVCSSWNRRITKSSNLPVQAHPADDAYIQDNVRATLTGTLRLLDDRFSVNPIAHSRTYSNKLAQLKVAASAGFSVPRTLVSNKFDDIRSFVSEAKDVCFKGYHARGWLTDDGPVHAMTTRLSRADLRDSRPFEIMPHIYQEYVPKKAEYRLTMFGRYSSSVKIFSDQLDGHASVDWRANPSYLSGMTFHQLPDSVIRAARGVMDGLGLRFGTFDIAETHEGDYYFFEVNEGGQWLWTELHCPECRLLQPFCEYLTAANEHYTWSNDRSQTALSAENVCQRVEGEVSGRYKSLFESDVPDGVGRPADERAVRLPAGAA